MILSRYTYENRPPIIVIPKCGTRFVRSSKWSKIDEINIIPGMEIKYTPITPDSTLIYRSPKEHILSAIQTDYVWGNYYGKKQHIEGNIRKSNLNIIIQNMFEDNSEHWSPYLYKNLYRIWSKTKFKLIHISRLNRMFDYEIEYKPEFFDSHSMPNYKSKEEILSMIPKDKLNRLYKLCDEDNEWLNKMLSNKKEVMIYEDIKKQIENSINYQ